MTEDVTLLGLTLNVDDEQIATLKEHGVLQKCGNCDEWHFKNDNLSNLLTILILAGVKDREINTLCRSVRKAVEEGDFDGIAEESGKQEDKQEGGVDLNDIDMLL